MSIQVTPIPRLTVLTVPAFTLGTANAAGSASTAIASDSTLLVFDTTLPDAITYGQSGAAGTSATAARRSHAHAMAAESAGAAKAWCRITSAGVLEDPDYNIASVTDTGTGNRTIIFDTDFSTTVYASLGSLQELHGAGGGDQLWFRTFAVGSIRLTVVNSAGAEKDVGTGQAFFGEQ